MSLVGALGFVLLELWNGYFIGSEIPFCFVISVAMAGWGKVGGGGDICYHMFIFFGFLFVYLGI